MRAIIENGGLAMRKNVFINRAISISEREAIPFLIFNEYLNAIDRASDTDSLRKEAVAVEFKLNRLHIPNEFNSGFTADGFGVYLNSTRLIYVECEVDLEM